ncbi:hypothetical protein Mgra_00009698 [Meloidogyne graminicola]|uniref:Uncharacterized protein n=1 Tax=Meloidogyne graminicola TaxID=189291 RepID=A0A8S9ZBA4_9BILA|nr:hypothetical protein Mgra_00009698 [Meloidogyne graminicola]
MSDCNCNNNKQQKYLQPTAPSLEININQNNTSNQSNKCNRYTTTPTILSSPKFKSNICRPPTNPPPPPPPSAPLLENEYSIPEEYFNKERNSRKESWRQLGRNTSIRAVRAGEVLRKRFNNNWNNNGSFFKLTLCELLFSVILLFLGILCACKTKEFCPYYSAIWTSTIFIINSIIGLIASKTNKIDNYIGHLVLSLISIVLCIIGVTIASINWHLIGNYRPNINRGRQIINPKADEEQMYKTFCLLGEHDVRRISYIYSHMDKYNFSEVIN